MLPRPTFYTVPLRINLRGKSPASCLDRVPVDEDLVTAKLSDHLSRLIVHDENVKC